MLAPYIHSGRLTILTNHKLHAVRMAGDNVLSITVEDQKHHDFHELVAPYFLDATECGDVLPQAGVEYVLGAESVDQTGEPNAVVGPPQPNDIQAFTYCFAMDYLEEKIIQLPSRKRMTSGETTKQIFGRTSCLAGQAPTREILLNLYDMSCFRVLSIFRSSRIVRLLTRKTSRPDCTRVA